MLLREGHSIDKSSQVNFDTQFLNFFQEKLTNFVYSELDNQMIELILRCLPDEDMTFQKPVHLNVCLSKDTIFTELVEVTSVVIGNSF